MRIKLAILEKDQSYLNRIVSVFNAKYADKFEIYSFTDEEIALSTLDSKRIDVFVVNECFEIDMDAIPKRCGFAYFVDSADVDMINEQRAICKYQKADLIYKQILSIYSENAGSTSGLKIGDESTRVIAFSSPNGGSGTSTAAAACAKHFAMKKQKVLYLNLEKYGSSDLFFSAEGLFDMSDIIYALKSKKTNLAMKLESCVKQDEKGVYFYSAPKVALDMLELTNEDLLRLVTELKLTGSYDYIILDMDFSLDKDYIKLYAQAHAVVWVGDGSQISNTKIQRAYAAASIKEQSMEEQLTNRLCLMYNKFSNKTGNVLEDIGIKVAGGVPKYEHATTHQIVDQIATMSVFDGII